MTEAWHPMSDEVDAAIALAETATAEELRRRKCIDLGHPAWWIDANSEYARDKFAQLPLHKRDLAPVWITKHVNVNTRPALEKLCAEKRTLAGYYFLLQRRAFLDDLAVAYDALLEETPERSELARTMISEIFDTTNYTNGWGIGSGAVAGGLTHEGLTGWKIDSMEFFAVADVAHIAYRLAHREMRATRRWQTADRTNTDVRAEIVCTYCRGLTGTTSFRNVPSDSVITRNTNGHTMLCAMRSFFLYGTKEWK